MMLTGDIIREENGIRNESQEQAGPMFIYLGHSFMVNALNSTP